jgi:hypothetical protein
VQSDRLGDVGIQPFSIQIMEVFPGLSAVHPMPPIYGM